MLPRRVLRCDEGLVVSLHSPCGPRLHPLTPRISSRGLGIVARELHHEGATLP